MLVTCWVLLIVFGFIGINLLLKAYSLKVNRTEIMLLIFSVFVSAIAAGVIWGGLQIPGI